MFQTILPFLIVSLFLAQAPHRKTISLRGLTSIGGGVVWASGTGATILRSSDDGRSWQTCPQPKEAAALDFRGIYAWSAKHAMAMSAGTDSLSRLYETVDGCQSWRLLFTNPDPEGFWDCLTFSITDPNQGALLGDPVQGRFTLFRSTDRGRHWIRDTSPALASSPTGEGAFAASNSSLVFLPGTLDLVFGTGGPGGPHIFRFDSDRKLWTDVALPFATKNGSSGIFSISFRNATDGMAVGGDYKQPQLRTATAFRTRDGGRTWIGSTLPPAGYRSAVAWDKINERWITAGPTGLDISTDNGENWKHLEMGGGNWNTLSPPWVAGSNGFPTRLESPKK